MVTWLTAAILAWTPGLARTPSRLSHVDGVAREILALAYAPGEAPFVSSTRAKTALLVAAVGSQESAFHPRVQAGDCAGLGGCDGGRAACYLQIHADDEGGYALTGDGEVAARWDLDEHRSTVDRDALYHNEDLRSDPWNCFVVGQHMLRRAMRYSSGSGLCAYTGEGGPCPKGAWRKQLADDYFRAHPPPVGDDALSGM